jgi:polyribonucleotide nucleotidyltransferase
MGLVTEGDKYAILTDIAGAEDHYGDMDFKVAGTRKGITALQMDIKMPNVSTAIMKEALAQAREGRMFLLDKMDEAIAEPRAELSKTAPRITTIQIPVDKIRDVIGKGGSVIRALTEETGAKIDIEDDGTVSIFAVDGEGGDRALRRIQDICATAEIGKTYLGKVVRIVDFGAFVEIFPGTDGLLHISEIAEHRVKQVTDELQEGDQIQVKCIGLEGNKIKLSRKAVLKELRDQMKRERGEPVDDEPEVEAAPSDADGNREGGGDRPPRRDGDRGGRGPSRGGDRGGRGRSGGGGSRGPRS